MNPSLLPGSEVAPMSTHPVEKQRAETRAPQAAEKRTGLAFRRHFTTAGRHPFDEVTWELRSAVINDEKGQPVFEQHDIEVPDHLEPDGDQHRGLEVLPRPARLAGPRDAACAGSSRAWSTPSPAGPRRRATSRRAEDLADLLGRAHAPARPPEGGLQQPGLVQRRDRERTRSPRPASSTRSRTRWTRSSASPRPRACSSSSARAPARTCRSIRSSQGAARRRRHRLRARLLHARLRRLRRRDQERRQDAARGQDGHPQRRTTRTSSSSSTARRTRRRRPGR